MKQRKVSPSAPRLHLAPLGTCVLNFIRKRSGSMCRGKSREEIKFTRPETSSALQIASETQIVGQKPSKADFYQKFSIFHFSKNRRDFILPSLWLASLKIFLLPSFIKQKHKLAAVGFFIFIKTSFVRNESRSPAHHLCATYYILRDLGTDVPFSKAV